MQAFCEDGEERQVSTEWKHLISFSIKEGKQTKRATETKARESCVRQEKAWLVLSQLKLEGLDVEAIMEFIPYHERL